jgi:hypothetical protein
MSKPNTTTVYGRQPLPRFKDLMLNRLAGGAVMEGLCLEVAQLASPFPYVDTARPGKKYEQQPMTEIVDRRSVQRNRLPWRGITPRRMQFALTHLVPSILIGQEVQATGIDVDEKDEECYIALCLSGEGADKLVEERKEAWGVLGRLGKFSIEGIPWLANTPEIRLAYIPTEVNPDCAFDLIDKVEASVQTRLPFTVALAPAYDEVLTVPRLMHP